MRKKAERSRFSVGFLVCIRVLPEPPLKQKFTEFFYVGKGADTWIAHRKDGGCGVGAAGAQSGMACPPNPLWQEQYVQAAQKTELGCRDADTDFQDSSPWFHARPLRMGGIVAGLATMSCRIGQWKNEGDSWGSGKFARKIIVVYGKVFLWKVIFNGYWGNGTI